MSIRAASRPLLAALVLALAPSAVALVGCDSSSSGGTSDTALAADAATDTASAQDTATQADTAEAPADTTPIAISSTIPEAGGCAPVGDFGITIRLSESVNPASLVGAIDVEVTTTGGSGPHTIPVKFGGGSTEIALSPDGDDTYWGASGTWTVEVAASVSDLAGNAMGAPYTWTFTSPCAQ